MPDTNKLARVISERLGKVQVGSLGLLPDVPFNVKVLIDAGIVRPTRPDRLAGVLRELRRWGASPAAGAAAAAIRYPDETMIIDELGELTFAEVHERSNKLAQAFAEQGIAEGDGVAILARNHRGFVDTVLAVSKLGANALFMNTMFSGPQLVDVLEREDPKAVVYDEEFLEVMEKADVELKRFVAWAEEGETDDPTIESLIEETDDASDLKPPEKSSKFIVLTSGTTGTPEGRSARPARHARADRGAALEDPAQGARDDGDRGAALSLLGLRALLDRALALLDLRAAPQVRPGGRRSRRSRRTRRRR